MPSNYEKSAHFVKIRDPNFVCMVILLHIGVLLFSANFVRTWVLSSNE